jgi:osmotically-inducible protein OsmY
MASERDDAMQGGGYGGLQGRGGEGRASDGLGGELQGGSYGRDAGASGVTGGAGGAGMAPDASTGYTRDDVQLAIGVQEALAERPELGTDAIRVRVEGGVATLSGTVVDDSLRTVAIRAAREAKGITDVRDDLRVGGASRRSD